ncbi:MAG TPA: Xaa-Pro peptidase family protein [Acidimicrobiia bacterium]|jgi:Xaa-Pro aminopeptidase
MHARYALGPFAVDWEERYDFPGLRAKRLAAVRDALAQAQVDGLVMWKNENVRYLTSLRAQIIAGKSTSLNGVFVTGSVDPVLLASGGEVDKAGFGMPWLSAIHAVPIMEQPELVDAFVAGTLRGLVSDAGLASGKIGVDQANISFIRALERHLPDVEIVDGDAVMQAARLVKLDEELAIIEESCAIGDSVTQRALDETKAGRREQDIAGDAMQTLYQLGGEMAHVITPFVATGEHMSPPHRICSDKIVRNGDLCFIDIGAMWNGYFADIGRTTIVGRPTKTQQKIYTAVYEGLMAGVATMRPGKTNADVSDAIVAKIADHGLDDRLFSLFIGHGIGMGANEPPYIGETLPGAGVFELVPNMVFAVEPLVWVPDVPGGGGVRIEDMVMVTEGDARILSRVEYEDKLLI